MEEYLEKLLSQIRCKKARTYILDEIKSHMEEQVEDNLKEGMDLQQAEKMAVADMGNPVEVGISLDRIHRPGTPWRLFIIMAIISLVGVILQNLVVNDFLNYLQSNQETYHLVKSGSGYEYSVILGFIIMCIVCMIDYTTIAKYSKLLGLSIISLGFMLLAGIFGYDVNGMRYYVGFGAFRMSATTFMMFYVPVYGGILYKYRNGGISSLLKVIVWLIVPVFITLRIPGIMTAGIMMISMLIQLTVAIKKGWFHIPIKKTTAILWSVLMIVPIISLFLMYFLHLLYPYQEARIRAFFLAEGDANYITNRIRAFNNNITLFGESGNDVFGSIPNINSDYIFSYIINVYGLIVGILVIALLASLIIFVFSICTKQKNELGLVMGYGCGMILGLNIIINILCSIGLFPPTTTFLPFLSLGRSNMILCYTLIGIIMSIYRYKNIYPRHVKKSAVIIQKDFTINM